ncbi:MAG: alpha/beta fold hydrolase [Chloroflexi bacterium]|nr:alpha/beta fold hydrolase [Chloroflexota bacterium]
MAQSPIMPGAEPIFARGGPLGILLMHGFSASPHEVLWWAQHLAADGHTVYAPRLAGHGTNPRNMARMHWQDWTASAADAYHMLAQQCERVVVGGLSMGAALSLITADSFEVAGVMALAAPLVPFPNLTPRKMRIAKLFQPFTDQTDRGPFADRVLEQQQERGERPLGRVRYGLWSSAAVEQLTFVMANARESLPHIMAPVLAVYSKGDETVRPHHLDALKTGLTRSTRVETHLLETSGHILTQDIEKETVFALSSAFVASL